MLFNKNELMLLSSRWMRISIFPILLSLNSIFLSSRSPGKWCRETKPLNFDVHLISLLAKSFYSYNLPFLLGFPSNPIHLLGPKINSAWINPLKFLNFDAKYRCFKIQQWRRPSSDSVNLTPTDLSNLPIENNSATKFYAGGKKSFLQQW